MLSPLLPLGILEKSTFADVPPDFRAAYQSILLAEANASLGKQSKQQNGDKMTPRNPATDLIHARVLGHLLKELFDNKSILGNKPARILVQKIGRLGNDSDEGIYDLGKVYRWILLRCFRCNRRNNLPSPEPLRSFDTLRGTVDDVLETTIDSEGAKKKALLRDGFRCTLSKAYDMKSCKQNNDLFMMAREAPDVGWVPTVCCPIIPDSTIEFFENGEKMSRPVGVLCARAFGLEDLDGTFSQANGIHDLRNVFTISEALYAFFDYLELWLENTKNPEQVNEYTICAHESWLIPKPYQKLIGQVVRFEVSDMVPSERKEEFSESLPDPRLLTLHAICARVMHMSGAENDADDSDICILANDGSDVQALQERLELVAMLSEIVAAR
ncbi:hypothetical protein VNI00_009121 [Paramarasmius palmivorus]|uniref:HNH nuclease domain-containing protein n=1 Tax=Paramarasmius palmivorus TaxID=297713 RepID=A0AAW0CPF5_9AGAR